MQNAEDFRVPNETRTTDISPGEMPIVIDEIGHMRMHHCCVGGDFAVVAVLPGGIGTGVVRGAPGRARDLQGGQKQAETAYESTPDRGSHD